MRSGSEHREIGRDHREFEELMEDMSYLRELGLPPNSRTDTRELPQVKQVVPRIQPSLMLQALVTTFGV